MAVRLDETVEVTALANIAGILPQLRANARRTEQERWVVEENLSLLRDAGVFRMWVPEEYGGTDLRLSERVRALSLIATACPSTAWASQLWAGNTWIATLFSGQAQDEVFTSPDVNVSAVLAPTGRLIPVDGGYRLSGSWRWNTGCRGAQWDVLAATLELPDGSTTNKVALVPIAELELVDDWYAYGAVGTGSSQTRANDVFVPEHRVADLSQLLTSTPLPGARPRRERNYAFFPYIQLVSLGAFPGMAR